MFGGASKALPRLKESGGGKTLFEFDYHLKRIEWKFLNTEKMPCDEERRDPNTTGCITSFLERETGCSLNLLGGDPNIPKYVSFYNRARLSRRASFQIFPTF